MQVADLVDEITDTVFERDLRDNDWSRNIKAHYAFMMGYAHFQMAHFDTARRYFKKIRELDNENMRLEDAAAYLSRT